MEKTGKLRGLLVLLMTEVMAILCGIPLLFFTSVMFEKHPIIMYILIFLWIIPPLSLPLSHMFKSEKAKIFLHFVGELWFAPFLYVVITSYFGFLATIITLFIVKRDATGIAYAMIIGYGVFIFSFVIVFFVGVINAIEIKIKKIDIDLGLKKPVRICFASDIHLGRFTGENTIRRIVKAINYTKCDYCLLGGDFFDMNYEALANPKKVLEHLRDIKAVKGIYGVKGNHDYYCTDPRKDEFIRNAGITILNDEVKDCGQFYLVGRDDISNPERMCFEDILNKYFEKNKRTDKKIIAIEHNPASYKDALEHGCNLLLCGHTHGGQTFPVNLLQKLGMKYPTYGLKSFGENNMYVSSGVGFWGLPVRLFVHTEIVVFDIK